MSDTKTVYIKLGGIICPIGDTLSTVRNNLYKGVSGLTKSDAVKGFNEFYLGHVNSREPQNKFSQLLERSLSHIKKNEIQHCASDDTILLISTSKGNIDLLPNNPFANLQADVQKRLGLKNTPLVISNACISGVLAINVASDLLRHGSYRNAIVLGIESLSKFVVGGFNSLFALSPDICRPYDDKRIGINLGEASAYVVLSVDEKYPSVHVGGSTNNDANHISSPSRTGEGLYRSIDQCLKVAEVQPSEIDFISAHGTSSIYNDEMESIALDRMGLNDVPVNSFKAYVGHSLGASGLVETMLGMISIKNGFLAKSIGYENHGVSREINVLEERKDVDVKYFLKTASGFGGCNSTLLLDCKP